MPPLFAEGTSDVTILTVAMAAITSLAMFGSACIGYLSGRDKLRYDNEHALMKQKIETLTDDVKECQEDRARLASRVDSLEQGVQRRHPND